jgi:hypothetical protein
MGQFLSAAQQYQKYTKQFPVRNPAEIFMYTSFAYYKAGRLQQSLEFIGRVSGITTY